MAEESTKLPNAERAEIDLRKLKDYCLNKSHPRGRHKARLFAEALGLTAADAGWLREALLQAARSQTAVLQDEDDYGTRWRIDAAVTRHERTAVVRTIWIVGAGDETPRLVTCWVM